VRVKLSRSDKVRMLLGRLVCLELALPVTDIASPVQHDALIMALRPHLVKEHMMQIQCIEKINPAEFEKLEGLIDPENRSLK